MMPRNNNPLTPKNIRLLPRRNTKPIIPTPLPGHNRDPRPIPPHLPQIRGIHTRSPKLILPKTRLISRVRSMRGRGWQVNIIEPFKHFSEFGLCGLETLSGVEMFAEVELIIDFRSVGKERHRWCFMTYHAIHHIRKINRELKRDDSPKRTSENDRF